MLPDNISFSSNPVDDLKSFFTKKKYSKVAVLLDENTMNHCYAHIKDGLPDHETIVVRSGEEQKNLQTSALIWEEMTGMALDRHAILVVVGGGVLGDMGGFCAATYKRGIDFMLIPTTLLAQVDASVGGKLGIDFNSFKNHIGVFQQPVLTLLYSGFLRSLPPAELRSGYAEVIKHCLISDKEMFNTIASRELSSQDWDSIIRHSVTFKARVTTEDPREKGLRKILNAGHTIGHALESHLLLSGTRILHGEAIAVGLISESYIAAKRGFLREDELTIIVDYILKVFGKVSLRDTDIQMSSMLALQDKKNRDNKVLCVLLEGIGKCKWDEEISISEIKDALNYYNALQM